MAPLVALFAAPAGSLTAQAPPAVVSGAFIAREDSGSNGLEVLLAADLLSTLRASSHVLLTGVPLTAARSVDLDLHAFSWPESADGSHPSSELVAPLSATTSPSPTIWSGTVRDDPGSEVYLAFSERGSWGWVLSRTGLVHLVSAPDPRHGWVSPRTRWIADDGIPAPRPAGPAWCGTPAETPRAPMLAARSEAASSPSIPLQCRIALETDWQYFQLFQDLLAARNYALSVLGAVSLRFSDQAGIVLIPVRVGIYGYQNDPWQTPDTPGSGRAGLLLDEFRLAWGGGAAPVRADLHHFLSGADLGGGQAYQATVCDPDWSFGVSTAADAGTTFPVTPGPLVGDFLQVAHGIGHGFDAIHTHEYCPPLDQCAPPPDFGTCQTAQVCSTAGTIMSYCHLCPGGTANISTYFHPVTVAVMRAFAESTCLTWLTGATRRVSEDASGAQGNSVSWHPSVSRDGRYVAFDSLAGNLVAGDTNGAQDVFVHDRETGSTTRVSVGTGGAQADGSSQRPSISADGRYVAFESFATNLVPGDANGVWDIFLHDTQTGSTVRVSVDSSGAEADFSSRNPSISGDGCCVAFESVATNLVPGDTNAINDVFVHDVQAAATMRVSVDSSGVGGNFASTHPSISGDGSLVAFRSLASNLVPGDTNGERDVFVHDRQTGVTTRASVDSTGIEANATCMFPAISADGHVVVFASRATNLSPGGTNGYPQVFAHDLLSRTTELVSVDSAGVQGSGPSGSYAIASGPWPPSISADGRHVAFTSFASNLVAGDTNGVPDVFVRDRGRGLTSIVSVASDGRLSDGFSLSHSMSGDGRVVAFQSGARSLVPNDSGQFDDIFVHERVPRPEPGTWARLGGGTSGSGAIPSFEASGSLQAGSVVDFRLSSGRPSSPAALVISDEWAALPFGGGVIWPSLLIVSPVVTDASGMLTVNAVWPAGPRQIFAQVAVLDTLAPGAAGVVLSNAVWGTSR